MRSADAATLLRIILTFPIVYSIVYGLNPIIPISLLLFVVFLDWFDGYLAVGEASSGRVSFSMYLNSALGNMSHSKLIKRFKERAGKLAKYGPRFDIAGDRITEYSMWILFTVLGIVPLFVMLLIVIRHSLVDALLGTKGTSSKMKTRFAQIVYSSNLARGGINLPKFAAFIYMILVYASGYPVWPAYVLIAVFLVASILRGAAGIYESLQL